MLPCLHVFCLACLKDNCSEKSPDKFFCPLCVVDKNDRKSFNARPWHSFEKIVENEAEYEARQRRLAELPATESRRSSYIPEGLDADEDETSRRPSLPQAPVMFPCTMHADRLADTFCTKCDQLACPKCISSFHRRCQSFLDIKDAVEKKRDALDSVYSAIANNLVSCENLQSEHLKRVNEIEAMRVKLLLEIKTFRTAMVNLVLEKEKRLSDQVNQIMDQMTKLSSQRESTAKSLVQALNKQLDVLNFSLSARGEGEILPLLPALANIMESNTAKLSEFRSQDDVKVVTFSRDENCFQTVSTSLLGTLNVTGKAATPPAREEGKRDLTLTPFISFHGGACDDVCEPLLTDIVLLMNGDVIMTDRDNKCVKKFNQSGRLLTRVMIDAIPSRITIVSNSRAAVSVMNKKAIYFLSLFGTVRILSFTRVSKIYSFLTSLGGKLLAGATNQCDCIDVFTEKGEVIRNIFLQKADKASIARPMYLTPTKPSVTINQQTSAADKMSDTDVLISDSGKQTLFRLDQTGRSQFCVRSTSSLTLTCPLGVTVHESGLTLLADRDTDSVLLFDEAGNFLKKALTLEQGLVKPCGIYAGHRGHVALTQVDGMVKIYKTNVTSV